MNNLSDNRTSTTASRKGRTSLLALIALSLCSLTRPAFAQYTWALCTVSPTDPAGGMAGIQIGSTQLWGRSGTGNLYQYVNPNEAGNPCQLNLIPSPIVGNTPVSFQHLAVGQGKSVWALSNGAAYSYQFPGWVSVPGTGSSGSVPVVLTSIGAGTEGTWGIDSASGLGTAPGAAYVYNSGAINLFLPPGFTQPTAFASIWAGNFAMGPWALDSAGNAWLYSSADGFQKTNAVLTQISVGQDEVWGVNGNSPAFEYNASTGKWFQPDPKTVLSEISANVDNNVSAVNSAGQVFFFDSTLNKFELASPQPPEKISQVRQGGAGIFALAKSTGHVYLLQSTIIP